MAVTVRRVRILLRLVLQPLILILLAVPARSEGAALAVGYVPNADFAPVFLAKEEGLFAKAGLDVTLTSVVNQHNTPAAITSGGIEIGSIAVPTFLLAVQSGVEIVSVAGFTRNRSTNPNVSLMVRQGMPFAGPASLEGKRVGIPGLKSAVDLHFRMWLLNDHVPIDRVNLVEVNFPVMAGMLKNRQIDASIAVEPFRTDIVQTGAGFVAADFMSAVSKNDAGLVWVATEDWAKTHAAERHAFLAGLQQGVAMLRQDPDAMTAVEKKYLKAAIPVSDDYDFVLTPADLSFYQAMMLKVGFLAKPIDLAGLLME